MNNIQRGISIAIPLLLIGLIVYFFSDLVAYAVIAWIISLLGTPVKAFLLNLGMRRWRLGNTMATLLTLMSFATLFYLVLSFFVPLIIEQANQLSNVKINDWVKTIEKPLLILGDWMAQKNFISSPNDLLTQINQQFSQRFEPALLADYFSSMVGLAGSLLIGFFSVLFISFFFLKDDGLFLKALQTLVPSNREKYVTKILKQTTYLLTRYFGGLVAQVTVITIIVFIGLSILGIQNALLIAFFTALVNLIPYLGPIIGGIFGLFMTITSNIDMPFETFLAPLLWKVALVFLIMQVIDNFLLQPFIFSSSVKAHPLEIFFVVLIGAKLGGIPGMILAIPTYTVLRVVASVLLSESTIVQKLTRSINTVE
ncbi:MAG TPA: AI-2E family transporter, partial [Saprospiraceae bacterium]|nr:AI-2E family transporter [Saprospiraceae bacterium]